MYFVGIITDEKSRKYIIYGRKVQNVRYGERYR